MPARRTPICPNPLIGADSDSSKLLHRNTGSSGTQEISLPFLQAHVAVN